ncbi:TolC family protein [Pseudoalteromonas phenolica]|uniref:TolC family protein n=1 Tax=Pseudoalteromonas phenolica TaxID=161398 RepID=UPI001486EB83|nr:TolC family protein [Pseudoalteromonas phenolica]
MLIICAALAGCNSTLESNELPQDNVPNNWFEYESGGKASDSWQEINKDKHLHTLIVQSISNNRPIRKARLELDIAKQQLIIADADFLPSLSSSFDYSKRKQAGQDSASSSYGIGFDLKYELDIWGKLSANSRQANLDYLSALASYEQQLINLVTSVSKSWFSLVESELQIKLQKERAELTKQSVDIIEKGYRQGLNSALDVYLARTELNNEQAKLFELFNSNKRLQRDLKTLLAEYPDANVITDAGFPELSSLNSLGLPSDVIKQKPAIQSAWFKLLAQDAALAYAHKQRFPSFNLSLSIDSSNEKLSDAIRFDQIGWNFLAGITAPIFNAGRLAANEEKQRLTLKSLELSYLEDINSTFKDIENSLANEQALIARLDKVKHSSENAKLAATLSFEQYQKGLVSYTTVLDAQKRSFDAQSNFISLNNQLLQNRFSLYQAIGGKYLIDSQEKQ